MKVDLHNFKEISSPYYILEEERLRANLSLIQRVASEAGIEIILAFKAYALWKTFPIFREYIQATTASSLYEARLAFEEFGNMAHTYSPAYTDGEIREIASMSSHLTFNSLTQYQRYQEIAREVNPKISLALRINPEYSEVGTDLYNPCAPGTRFGVTHDKLADTLPPYIEGFHCHCHCESGSDVFERTLVHIEEKFSKWFPQLKWINFGGGHLMTRKDYDVPRLIRLMKDFRSRYPWLHVILEPGSAFGWQTGPLVAQVVDVVEDRGIQTAIVNVSFTCHMPDCLEMPYMPAIRGAETIEHSSLTIDHSEEPQSSIVNVQCSMKNVYRIGGNSCLSGDFMGFWRFDHELKVGENIIFEDMLHYTTVKTCMFNGIGHPSIAIVHPDGEMETLRQYTYEDYRDR
ncbi:MAG: carboxynorspermidine decarboxylase, partial [Prevotella sp.]|nr:carboxynorspermidine decarboxylase [Prevotella sp.]